MTSHEAPITFSARSTLVTVPVVVRDKHGKAVGNLHREDFQLLDKGKPQIIASFSIENPRTPRSVPLPDSVGDIEEKSSSVPGAAAPSRFVAYFFDDVHSKAENLLQTQMAAAKHFESLDAATRAAIFTTSGQTMLTFTDDREKIRETLRKIRTRTVNKDDETCPADFTYYMADMILNKRDSETRKAAVARIIECAPPLAAHPEIAVQMMEQTAETDLQTGEHDAQVALATLKDAVRELSMKPGSRSLVLASTGFFLTTELRASETEVIDRAIRANVVINTLDARGLYTDPTMDVSVRRSNRVYDHVRREEATANADVLSELAASTGGRFFQNNNDLTAGFNALAEQPEFIYLLGFSPQNLKLDGSYHSLKVILKEQKNIDIQARRGYYAPAHATDSEKQAREEIREAVFSLEDLRELAVDLNLQFFKTGDFTAKLNVVATIDPQQVRFQKKDNRNQDSLVVVAAVFDQNGNFVKGIQKTITMKLEDATLQSMVTSRIPIKTAFDVAPGNYVVRLVVRDAAGETMAARSGAIRIP